MNTLPSMQANIFENATRPAIAAGLFAVAGAAFFGRAFGRELLYDTAAYAATVAAADAATRWWVPPGDQSRAAGVTRAVGTSLVEPLIVAAVYPFVQGVVERGTLPNMAMWTPQLAAMGGGLDLVAASLTDPVEEALAMRR